MDMSALVSVLVQNIFSILFVEQHLVLSRCNLIRSRVLRLRWNFLFRIRKRQKKMNEKEKEFSWNMLLYTLVALLPDTSLNTRSFLLSK